MISDERVEIIDYILHKKAVSVNIIKTLLNINNLKEMTREQALALEQLLSLV